MIPASPSPGSTTRFAGRWKLRDIRLTTGLILLAFLTTHFSNHALGLLSVAAMERGREVFNLLWRNPPGLVLL